MPRRRSSSSAAALGLGPVTIIGAGHVGTVLGTALVAGGGRVGAVISRTATSARRLARRLRAPVASTRLEALPAETRLIYLTVPHGAIAEVAAALAEVPAVAWRRIAVCHASGVLTAAVLAPLQARGAAVFSFHPLQLFPRDLPAAALLDRARGIFFGVDGDARALRVAARFAAALGGRLVRIPPERRALYYAACVVASNHLTAVMWTLQRLHAALGAGAPGVAADRFYPLYRPLIESTLQTIDAASPAAALTGAVARGGVETVAAHLEAVRAFAPAALTSFARLTEETIALAQEKGSLNEAGAARLRDLLLTAG